MINRRKFIKNNMQAGLTGYLGYQALDTLSAGEVPEPGLPGQPAGNQPDIIFFMTDQQRWDALGMLNPHIHMPEGLRKAGYQTAGFGKMHWGRPLFLYLSFLKPHAGLNVPKRFEDLYDINDIPDTEQPLWKVEKGTHLAFSDIGSDSLGPRYQTWREAWTKMTPVERRRTTLRYYANCSWLDSYFGQVMDKLDKLGRLKNALIVFTSDHGEMLGERNFRFTKYCLYDSSVRVPVILSGSVVPENLRGTVDDRPVELVDLYPTLTKAAGTSMELKSPGLNLLGNERHAGSFSEYHDSGAPAYMWRTKKWKLILFMDKPLEEAKLTPDLAKGELYDLEADPHEWSNLYEHDQYASVREHMKTALLMHLACTWSSLTNINRRSG